MQDNLSQAPFIDLKNTITATATVHHFRLKHDQL